MRDDIVGDANLIEQCFTVIRQLLICKKDEVVKMNPKIEEIIKNVINQVVNILGQKMKQENLVDLRAYPVRAR